MRETSLQVQCSRSRCWLMWRSPQCREILKTEKPMSEEPPNKRGAKIYHWRIDELLKGVRRAPDHIALVEGLCSVDNQLPAMLLQVRVVLLFVISNAVSQGILHHSLEEVRIPQPLRRLLDI